MLLLMEKRLKPAQNVLEQPRKIIMANLSTSLWECFFIIGGCMNKLKEEEYFNKLKLYIVSYSNDVALGIDHTPKEKEYTENRCTQVLKECPSCIFINPKTTGIIFHEAMDLGFDKVVYKIGTIITSAHESIKKQEINVTKEKMFS